MVKSNLDDSRLPSTKQRKNLSKVWEDFTKIRENGADWAICNHCNKKYVGSSRSGTTHLKNHLERCPKIFPKRIIRGGGGQGGINEADINDVSILVQHGGRWINSEYVGGTTRGMLISSRITYTELKDRLYQKLKIEPDKPDITMKFLCSIKEPNSPLEIGDDEDVRFFIKENSIDVRIKYPLCVQRPSAPVELATQTLSPPPADLGDDDWREMMTGTFPFLDFP